MKPLYYAVMDYLQDRGRITVRETASRFRANPATVRRVFDYLRKNQAATFASGGGLIPINNKKKKVRT